MTNAVEIKSVTPPWIGSLAQGETPASLGPFEPFVDENVIARFLQMTPRRVLEMARKKEIPAHPIGHTRKTWRFRLSEIDAHFSAPKKQAHATMTAAVPETKERNRLV